MIISTMLAGCAGCLISTILAIDYIKVERKTNELRKRSAQLKAELNEKRKELYSLMSDETEDS